MENLTSFFKDAAGKVATLGSMAVGTGMVAGGVALGAVYANPESGVPAIAFTQAVVPIVIGSFWVAAPTMVRNLMGPS